MAKKKKELSLQQLMKNYKSDYLKKLIKQYGKDDGTDMFNKMEEAGMFNKGGAAIKKAVGPQDYRKGGMTLSIIDNRKNK